MLINIGLPLVSAIIPTYNRGYALHRTIDAVINQTYKNLEITIVDEGSMITQKILFQYLETSCVISKKYILGKVKHEI